MALAGSLRSDWIDSRGMLSSMMQVGSSLPDLISAQAPPPPPPPPPPEPEMENPFLKEALESGSPATDSVRCALRPGQLEANLLELQLLRQLLKARSAAREATLACLEAACQEGRARAGLSFQPLEHQLYHTV